MTASDLKLTQKQEAFCLAYLETGNASEAYRRAYNAAKMKPETITNKASALLRKGNVRARVEELREKAASGAVMSLQEALERLSVLARTGIAELVDFRSVELGKDAEGDSAVQSVWTFKDSALQDPMKLAAIAELTAGRDGLKLKTHSPLQAIQQLAKMQGWEAAQKLEVKAVSVAADMSPQDAARAYQDLMGEA